MSTARNGSIDGSRRDSPGSALLERLNGPFRKLLVLVPVGIIGNILYCLATTDRGVVASIVHFTPGYLVLAALLSVVPWFTCSLRLFIWSRFLKQPLEYGEAFRIAVTADLGGALTPPLVGGSAVKIGMLMNRGYSAGTSLSLPALENMEDALFFLIMVPLALTASSSWDLPQISGMHLFAVGHWLPAAGAGVLAVGVLALVLTRCRIGLRWPVRLERLREKTLTTLRNFLMTFRLVGSRGKTVLLLTMVLTAVQWTCRYSIISLLLAGIGVPVRPVLFMVLQVFVFALMTLVPTPGASGGAEVIFSLLYKPFLPDGTIGLATLGWRFFTFYLHLLLAAALSVLLWWRPARTGQQAGEQQEAAGELALNEE